LAAIAAAAQRHRASLHNSNQRPGAIRIRADTPLPFWEKDNNSWWK